MTNETYEKNLNSLKKYHPLLFNEFNENLSKELSKPDTLVSTEYIIGRRQIPTFAIHRTSDNQSIHGHSIFDPSKEAEKRISVPNFSFAENERIIQLGFGFGHESRLLLNKIKHPLIVVVEPFFSIFKLAMENVDLSDIFSSQKVILSLSTTPENLKNLFSIDTSFLNIPNFKLLKLPHADFCPGITDNVATAIKQIKTLTTLCLNTGITSGATILKNTIVNFSNSMHYPGINSLTDKFQNRPVFIVAPGPSLKKNGPLLREVMGKELIISCDTAVKPLLEMGVKPDIITSIDYQILNYYKLRGIDTSFAALAASLDVTYFIPYIHKGCQFNYFHDPNLQTTFKYIFGDKGKIATGGSVLTDSFSIALLTGADPVVFVGVDLSFPEMKYYTDGTFDNGSTSKMINNGKYKMIEIDDIYGNKVNTSSSFYEFLSWLGTNIKTHKNTSFIDATEGGAKIEGTQIDTLKNTIEKYVKSECLPPGSIIQSAFNSYVPPENEELLKHTRKYIYDFTTLRKTAKQAHNIAKNASQIVNTSNDLKGNTKLISELKRINRKRQEFQSTDKISHMSFVYPLINKYLAEINYLQIDESAPQKEQYSRMLDIEIDSFKGIEKSCCALIRHFEFLESQITIKNGEDYV